MSLGSTYYTCGGQMSRGRAHTLLRRPTPGPGIHLLSLRAPCSLKIAPKQPIISLSASICSAPWWLNMKFTTALCGTWPRIQFLQVLSKYSIPTFWVKVLRQTCKLIWPYLRPPSATPEREPPRFAWWLRKDLLLKLKFSNNRRLFDAWNLGKYKPCIFPAICIFSLERRKYA